MEMEFVQIRTMIKKGEPLDEIAARVESLVSDLREVLPQIQGGFVLKAEPGPDEEGGATGAGERSETGGEPV